MSLTDRDNPQNVVVQQALLELVRAGVERFILAALELEADQFLAGTSHLRDDRGQALTVRNGHGRPRSIPSCVGPLTITAPRVHDRRPQHVFRSHILPPYVRGLGAWRETLPRYYLSGMLHGSFGPAVQTLLDPHGATLSPQRTLALINSQHDDWAVWANQPLEAEAWTQVWIEAVALEPAGVCDAWPRCMVAAGARRSGPVEVLALAPDADQERASLDKLRERLAARGLLVQKQMAAP